MRLGCFGLSAPLGRASTVSQHQLGGRGCAWAVALVAAVTTSSCHKPGELIGDCLVPNGQCYTLKINKIGVGSGKVTGFSIDCGAECAAQFPIGGAVSLLATPDQGSSFDGWSGCDNGNTMDCTVTLSADREVTAKFLTQAQCDCAGRTCGANRCGELCGSCTAPAVCNSVGACVCTPNCTGRTCGDDGCGGSCGTCQNGTICTSTGTCADQILLGVVPESPIVHFGGGEHCQYTVQLTAIEVRVDSTNVQASTATARMTEVAVPPCPYGPIAPNVHRYAYVAGGVSGSNVDVSYGMVAGTPSATARFVGTLSADGSATGNLTVVRANGSVPCSTTEWACWTVVVPLTLQPEP